MPTVIKLPDVLTLFEKRFRNDHWQEHGILLSHDGQVIVERSGDFDSVEFTPEELKLACLGLVSHTHPRALPPSGADLSLAAEYGLTLRAIGVAPDTGQRFEYTVKMPAPSEAMAIRIKADFDNEEEQAEKELANKSGSDLQWQREARHLAVRRLAKKYNFHYQRVWRDAPLTEATKHERARLDMLSSAENTLREQVFNPLSANLVRLLIRYGGQGAIPAGSLDHLRSDMAALVQKTILGKSDAAGVLAPYTISRGQVVPRSVYFATLWGLMRNAAEVAAERHATIMRKHLPDDIRRAFEMATISPFDKALSEMSDQQNDYDPMHLWVGPDGKQLADRIWNVAGDMRRKIDQFLTAAVSVTKKNSELIPEFEEFMKNQGSYEGMRLGRTQTEIAYAQADSIAAQGDPFVDTYSFFTAPTHKCCDICDQVEAGSPYPKDDIKHLPPQHPECICSVIWNIADDIDGVIQRLRTKIEDGLVNARRTITDIIGPLSKRFLDALFGAIR